MIISMNLGADSYPIHLERGALAKADQLFKLDRKVLIVTDSGVPKAYADTARGEKRLWCQMRQPLFNYLSFKAAIPGSSLPSRNSREAPPPVEI